jgi:hypothetical protein
MKDNFKCEFTSHNKKCIEEKFPLHAKEIAE